MFFPFTKIKSVFALFSSYILSKPYADWAEKYRKKSQSDTHFRTVGKICFPNAVIVADRFHVIRQAFWAMEQVRKNEQNKLSRGLRRYFKRSKHLLRKPMEALSSEEQERLLRDAELPELQKSDPFLQRCTEKTAPGLSTPTRSWIIVFFASTPTIDIEPDKCRSCRQGKAARLSRSAAQSTFRSAKSSWNSACQKVPEGFP